MWSPGPTPPWLVQTLTKRTSATAAPQRAALAYSRPVDHIMNKRAPQRKAGFVATMRFVPACQCRLCGPFIWTKFTIVANTRLSFWGRLPLLFVAMATTACSGDGGATNSTDVGASGTASAGTSNSGGRLDSGGAATSLGGAGGRGGAAAGAGTANGFGGPATTTGGWATQGGGVSSTGGAISSAGGAATTIGGAVNAGVKLGVYCGN